IVDGIDPTRLHTILEMSIEQYKKHKKLESDLKEAQTKLADRKDVEKFKVLLMQLHGLPEDTAFQLLRKNAMSHRITIGKMARRLLDAQKLLNDQLK
ncbi:ANTAR domain-containing protein, partial [Escherichia coli]|nr:ANTAR domain-containing protein [Escherichia coli]